MAATLGEKALIAGSALGTVAGLVAAGLTPTGAFAAGAAALKGAEYIVGLGSGALSDQIKNRLGAARNLADIHRNHHLEAVIRQAVADVLAQTATDFAPDSKDAEALIFVGTHGRLVIEDAPTLVTDIFAQTAAAGPENPLDADGWRVVVAAMVRTAKRDSKWAHDKHHLSAEAEEAAVLALAEHFPGTLRNLVVPQGEESPAFAKLVLLMLGETLALVRASATAPPGLADDLTAAQVTFRDGLAETVRAEVKPVFDALADHVTREHERTRELIRQGFEKQAQQPAPVATPTAPPPTEAFQGRAAFVEAIVAKLTTDRALAVTGMGGIGKTEVARAVAQAITAAAPAWAEAGVWYVDLNAAESVDALLQAITTEWGLDVPQPSGATLGRVLDAPRLYVLDDVEQALAVPGQLADVRTLLRDLIAYAPSARFLVTSRRFESNLGLRQVVTETLDAEAARGLFAGLAAAVGYTDRAGDEAGRETLLGYLDGLPLAITLAAGLLDDTDLAGVLRRWETKRTTALAVAGAEGLSKDDDLDLSIAMSMDALPDGLAREVVALFPLLPAGATGTLLTAVFGDDGEDAAVLLRRRGLLQRDGDRFTMRVPLRAWAERHTPPEAERVAALDAYLLALAQEANARVVEDTARVNPLLTLELPTFDAALARMDAASVARLVNGLRRWLTFARPVGVADRLRMGQTASEEIGDRLGAANSTKALGDVHLRLGEYGAARDRYQQALVAFEEIGAPLGAANCTQALGDVHRVLGEYSAARDRYEQALGAYQEIGSTLGAANCTRALGDVLMAQGEYGAARDRYEQALGAYQEIGATLGAANGMQGLGDVHRSLEDHATARSWYDRSLLVYREIGDRLNQAYVLGELGKVEAAEGHPEHARSSWRESLRIAGAIQIAGQGFFLDIQSRLNRLGE